jgi:hypothetical protein
LPITRSQSASASASARSGSSPSSARFRSNSSTPSLSSLSPSCPSLEPQPRRARVGRRLGRVSDGPAARHAEVHVHHDVGRLARRASEEREEVLSDSLAAAERPAVDELRTLGEAAVGRGGAVRRADEPARVLRGDPVHGVALDHRAGRAASGDRKSWSFPRARMVRGGTTSGRHTPSTRE